MFTVACLGIDGRLATTLVTSNPIDSMISIARTTNRTMDPLERRRDGAALDRRRHDQTPNGPSAASRAPNRCANSSHRCTDTPVPTPPHPLKLSAPRHRVHMDRPRDSGHRPTHQYWSITVVGWIGAARKLMKAM
jgi:hypothetical protein